MTVDEALGQIVLALAQPEKAVKIRAILKELEFCAYEQGQEAFDATLHQRETNVTA